MTIYAPGAIGDLKHASDLARRMVIEFGMSDEIGPVFLGGDSEVFIAKDWGHQRSYSEEVAAKVDKEIRRILEEQFERAKQVLLHEREALDRVVKYLIEYERITGEEFEKIFHNELWSWYPIKSGRKLLKSRTRRKSRRTNPMTGQGMSRSSAMRAAVRTAPRISLRKRRNRNSTGPADSTTRNK